MCNPATVKIKPILETIYVVRQQLNYLSTPFMRNALYAVAPVPVSIIRGNPRILLLVLKVMIREFESRRGEILSLFAKFKNKRINNC